MRSSKDSKRNDDNSDNSKRNDDNSDNIKIMDINKPTKEKGREKIKELSEFLSKTWYMPINPK